MGLYTKLPDNIKEVDVIIAGGGTSGCVLASRLADADPALSILVIEGGSNNNITSIAYPAFFIRSISLGVKTTIFYKANKSKAVADRELIVPSGGILGGGSSANFMVYNRGHRSDFDSWNSSGWSAEEMLPYLKKLETYHGPGPKDRHGFDGPIHVSSGTFRSLRVEDDFIRACSKVGYPEKLDLQTLDSNNGVDRALRYVSPDGKRQDVASKYLHPRLKDNKHPNLHVLVESKIVRVLFDDKKKATGVEFKSSLPRYPEVVECVKARKMVVVSCGACGTPPVLERSGVGNPEILKRAGVTLVADLPGVGHDYQDHEMCVYSYKTSLKPEETLDEFVSGRISVEEMVKRNDKRLGWNAMDLVGKFRPTPAEVAALGPEFQEAWDCEYKDKHDRPLSVMIGVTTFPAEHAGVFPGQYFSIAPFVAYPYSRGHMHITGPGLDDPLDFDLGFLKDELDLKIQLWMYKTQREIIRRMDTYRGEVEGMHPSFAPGSAAVCGDADGPVPDDAPRIAYSAEDDAAIEKWVRENIRTNWHSLGTCKMAPHESMGVVDPRLKVYGVEGLRLVDLSIAPLSVAANTNNTAIAVGERAADLIIEDLLGPTAASV